uniref:Prefoldin subunit 4 n=1 Tax=Oryzias sinensis TaxID=183150 RepID=A0A8C7WR95_9TELE
MFSATGKKTVGVEDIVVTFEDQQKTNKINRNTSLIKELENEIEANEKTLQNLQDSSDDIMMLDDDTTLISYHIGGVFVSRSQKETQKMLESAKEALEEEVRGYEDRVSSMQQVLNGLEVQLCAKFGDNINLEADES